MTEPRVHKRRRNLPHWTRDGSVYFITFRTADGPLSNDECKTVLDHLRSGQHQFYELPAAVVMPDHVHLLLQPIDRYDLSRIMQGIKGVSARKINAFRGAKGTVWQDESWDRIVRDADEFAALLQYMADNPVKAGLITLIKHYPFWYFDENWR